MTLVKLNDRTYVNPQFVVMVVFNAQTLKAGVFLSSGVIVESDLSFEDTAKALNGASLL